METECRKQAIDLQNAWTLRKETYGICYRIKYPRTMSDVLLARLVFCSEVTVMHSLYSFDSCNV